MSLSPGSPGTLLPVVPVSPASPPRVSVHCHPGTSLGSPRDWRHAAVLLFPTTSLPLGGHELWVGGGEDDAPAPCLWQRHLANSACWVVSCIPWACMRCFSSAHCPGTHPCHMPPLLCYRWSLLVQDPEGHGQDSPQFPCPMAGREGGRELRSGQESSSQCGRKPAVGRPRGQKKGFHPIFGRYPGVTEGVCAPSKYLLSTSTPGHVLGTVDTA